MSITKNLVTALAIAAFSAAVSYHTGFTTIAVAQTAARLNPNTATEAQLRTIPQLTPELVALVMRGRPYATIGALNTALAGKLNAEQTRLLYSQLFVPIKLNSASEADIMLIPGMTRRMAHEFEEYRPYTSLDQFNREIGKYVDANEVARLRSYVTLE